MSWTDIWFWASMAAVFYLAVWVLHLVNEELREVREDGEQVIQD